MRACASVLDFALRTFVRSRSVVLAAVLMAAWPAAPAPAQISALSHQDGPAAAATWAKEMLQSLRISSRRDSAGSLVSLQPLDPGEFAMLSAGQRRKLYEWLLHAFAETALDRYELVDQARLRDIARAMEAAGAADWMDRYLEVLERASARINIICTGSAGTAAIALSCSAVDRRDGVTVGRAPASFQLEWLSVAVALDMAVRSMAGAVVQRVQGQGQLGEVRVVDLGTRGETPLSRHVAASLEDAIHEQTRSHAGSRPVGAGGSLQTYRVEAEVGVPDAGEALLRLWVEIGHRRVHIGRRVVALPKHLAVKGDELLAAIVLPDGLTLADWVLLAEDRLQTGEHTRLLAEARAHIRKYGRIAAVLDIQSRAESVLVEGIRISGREDAPAALRRLQRIKRLTGERPAFIRLEARAQRLLGDYRAEASAHVRWLRATPQDHPKRREVLSALARARSIAADGAKFADLLGRPLSPEAKESSVGWTDLHYAALLNLPGAITALVDAGMAPDTRLKHDGSSFGAGLKETLAAVGHKGSRDLAYGETPLMIASVSNAADAVTALTSRGADVNAVNSRFRAPLHLAAYAGANEVVTRLIAAGADVNLSYFHYQRDFSEATAVRVPSPLIIAADEPANKEIMLQLIAAGADVGATDPGNKSGNPTALHMIMGQDAGEVVEALIAAGANVNEIEGWWVRTPLHLAAAKHDSRAMRILLAHQPDIEAFDGHGQTPLHVAAAYGAQETAEILLASGADIHSQGENGGATPLQLAAASGSEKMVAFFLNWGATVTFRDRAGARILHYAAKGNARQVAALLAKHDDMHLDLYINEEDKRGWTPLHYAAEANAAEMAQWLIVHGARKQARNNDGRTALHLAAESYGPETVKRLLEHGADIHATEKVGRTALHLAAAKETRAVVEALLDRGANTGAKDDYGNTPLHVGSDDREIVEVLVHRGANVNAQNNDGDTPLHFAAKHYKREPAETLLDRGANVNAQNNNGDTPLHLAAKDNEREPAEILLDRGANINGGNNDGNTPLHLAVRSGAHDTAELLLERRAAIHAQEREHGAMPLHYAAFLKRRKLAELLVRHGANVVAADKYGRTSLHWAVFGDGPKTAEWLIEHGANVDATDVDGETPLHESARKNAHDMAVLLVERGADVNRKKKAGWTPLHLAAGQNARETAEWLIESGARIDEKTDVGNTPLHLAARNNHQKTVALLLDWGANIHAKEQHGNTPLLYAAFENARETVELLIERGADVNARGSAGFTPFDAAKASSKGTEMERAEMLATLRRLGGRCAKKC